MSLKIKIKSGDIVKQGTQIYQIFEVIDDLTIDFYMLTPENYGGRIRRYNWPNFDCYALVNYLIPSHPLAGLICLKCEKFCQQKCQ